MPTIKISEKVKKELEELKRSGEFKSLDAVIRHYINSSVEMVGGIFLLSEGGVWNNVSNVRYVSIKHNFSDIYATPPKTIKLYKCLKCNTLSHQEEAEPIIVPNCMGCGKGMTPITIQIGLPEE